MHGSFHSLQRFQLQWSDQFKLHDKKRGSFFLAYQEMKIVVNTFTCRMIQETFLNVNHLTERKLLLMHAWIHHRVAVLFLHWGRPDTNKENRFENVSQDENGIIRISSGKLTLMP